MSKTIYQQLRELRNLKLFSVDPSPETELLTRPELEAIFKEWSLDTLLLANEVFLLIERLAHRVPAEMLEDLEDLATREIMTRTPTLLRAAQYVEGPNPAYRVPDPEA